MHWLLLACSALAFAPGQVRAEIFIDKLIARGGLASAPAIQQRRLLVNGVAAAGRNWIVERDYARFAAEVAESAAALRAKERRALFQPVINTGSAGLSVVEFGTVSSDALDPANMRARVLIALPMERAGARQRTSVWETEMSLGDVLQQLRDASAGMAPGRDHPFVGALPASQRVNVVESVGPGYSYSAIYVSAQAPRAVVQSSLAQLQARGAKLEAEQYGDQDANASLTYAGRRIDLSAARARSSAQTHVVLQTDLPPQAVAQTFNTSHSGAIAHEPHGRAPLSRELR